MSEEYKCKREIHELLEYSKNPSLLLSFLKYNPLRIGAEKSNLYKSIIVYNNCDLASNIVISSKESNGKGQFEWPMVERTGKYSPSMRIPDFKHQITTDPDEQRIGCYYINLRLALEHFIKCVIKFLDSAFPSQTKYEELIFKDIKKRFKDLSVSTNDAQNIIEKLRELTVSKDEIESFTEFFKEFVKIFSLKLQGKSKTLEFNKILEKRIKDITNNNVTNQGLFKSIVMLKKSIESDIHLLRHKKEILAKKNGCKKHILITGCGDISMNFWNVAFIHSKREKGGEIISVPEEPLDRREYSCLICWDEKKLKKNKETRGVIKDYITKKVLFYAGSSSDSPSVSIGNIRFSKYSTGPDKVRLVSGEKSENICDVIKYAIYGQRLVWKGEVIEPREIITECSDIRHVLKLTNLNPKWSDKQFEKNRELVFKKLDNIKEENTPDWLDKIKSSLFSGGKPPRNDGELTMDRFFYNFHKKPRYIFGVNSNADIWLGEYALLSDTELLKSACEHPIDICLSDLGTSKDWITVCLIADGYNLKYNRDTVSKRGDFTWDFINPTDPKLVLYPELNTYPCTMIGVGHLSNNNQANKSADNNNGDLFLLAWGHSFKEDQSYTIFQCAEILRDLGAQAVLLIDEGRDVFHHFFRDYEEMDSFIQEPPDDPEQNSPVPPVRPQIRGSLSFWIKSDKT